MPSAPPLITADDARLLLLQAQGLLTDPARPVTPAAVLKQIRRMGFVQIDTINVVDRAHHHILRSRFDAYQPRQLTKLLERDRSLFEHWTHDASIIPTDFLPHWLLRFQRYADTGFARNKWWKERMGDDAPRIIESVYDQIEQHGPLTTGQLTIGRDNKSEPWWGWTPEKAAAEFLWRSGRIAITRRESFRKVYDLTSRVFPHITSLTPPSASDHIDWACRAALDRLGIATPTEIAAFFRAIPIADTRAWCRAALTRNDIIEISVESADGSPPRSAFTLPDLRRRIARCPQPPDRMRILSPFDPVIRDRDRLKRLFNFDYRLEAFTPTEKRKFGYFVLPVLDRDQLIARLDAKLHRDDSRLEVKGLWWEPSIKPTKARRTRLDAALQLFARQQGADSIDAPSR